MNDFIDYEENEKSFTLLKEVSKIFLEIHSIMDYSNIVD